MVSGLTALYSLELEGTRITDASLAHLSNHLSMSYLNLSNTEVTNTGLEHLTRLFNLYGLLLNETKVDSDSFQLLAELPALRRLHLNGISIKSLKGLSDHRNPLYLTMTNADINDSAIEGVTGLNFTHLNITGTAITETGIRALANQFEGIWANIIIEEGRISEELTTELAARNIDVLHQDTEY